MSAQACRYCGPGALEAPFRLADALEDDGTVSYATVRRCEDCGHLEVVS